MEKPSPVSKQEAKRRVVELLDQIQAGQAPHKVEMISYYSKSLRATKYVLYIYDNFSLEEVKFHFCDRFPFVEYVNRAIIQAQAEPVVLIEAELTEKFRPLIRERFPEAYNSPASLLRVL